MDGTAGRTAMQSAISTTSLARLLLIMTTLSACQGSRSDAIDDALGLRAAPAPGTLSTTPWTVELECPCEPLAMELAQPLDARSWLDVRVHWDGTQSAGAVPTLSGPAQQYGGKRGFDATRIKVDAAPAGRYTLALDGSGRFTVTAFTRSADQPKTTGDRRLPNIVVMVPIQIGFDDCDEVERVEQGAQRCLRLGNAIGNNGDGPLEVHLGWVDAALALAGEAAGPVVDGLFFQRLHGWDSPPTDRPVGTSDFHPSHAHWHYDGFAEFSLFEVDPATGLRGRQVAAGKKSGFCFLDWGPMAEGEARREDGGRAAQDCLIPAAQGWSMGISTGWFDFYWSDLTDQYVEASNVGDGLFELVSRADPDDWLLEVDETDNVASALISIQGDTVKVLEGRGWYRIPPGTANANGALVPRPGA
jgi:hypothetical protein